MKNNDVIEFFPSLMSLMSLLSLVSSSLPEAP